MTELESQLQEIVSKKQELETYFKNTEVRVSLWETEKIRVFFETSLKVAGRLQELYRLESELHEKLADLVDF